MRQFQIWILVSAVALLLVASAANSAEAEAEPVFEVPRLEGIVIDGDASDWGENAFRVEVICGGKQTPPPADDFDAKIRVGWDQRGLLVLLSVRDDVVNEPDDEKFSGEGDLVRVLTGNQPGGAWYLLRIKPGADPLQPRTRRARKDRRPEHMREQKLSPEVAGQATDEGYAVEVLLRFEDLDITPEPGAEAALQVMFWEFDGRGDKMTALSWHPRAVIDADSMYSLRLTEQPGLPVKVAARAEFKSSREMTVKVYASPDLAGKDATLRQGTEVLGSGTLVEVGGRAEAEIVFSLPPRWQDWSDLMVEMPDQRPIAIEMADAIAERAREITGAEIVFEPFCFSGTDLPHCDFKRPARVRELVGDYSISVRFFDAQFNEVTEAAEPGRYGAVVTIARADRSYRRFATLYRLPSDEDLWPVLWRLSRRVNASLELPPELGVDPKVAGANSRVLGDYLRDRVFDGFWEDGRMAALLAGLSESKPGDKTDVYHDAIARDRQWWVDFKRRFYGTDKLWTEQFACPRPIEGPPARVIREGPLPEAGMKPDAPEKIDVACQTWAADSDDAFAICIVRHGVIVMHEAYGTRDGQPMTVTTPSRMASTTKLMSGTLMMMLVDQGLVDLDAPVGTYLPAFRGIEVETPLTIRHCYTHTNGLWGHWGDVENDFEELIAGYYPYLEVGKRFQYNGAGYALGGKVIEMVSGESIPHFYRYHLLKPLGCEQTTVVGTSSDAASIPLDIAKIGQMLLNKGAYGNMRFFSPETLEKMLPHRLTTLLGPETTVERGIGTYWYPDEVLGEGTFGHAGSSGATLMIDPTNDLVIVVTRNSPGENYFKYQEQFIQAVVDAIAD